MCELCSTELLASNDTTLCRRECALMIRNEEAQTRTLEAGRLLGGPL